MSPTQRARKLARERGYDRRAYLALKVVKELGFNL
jgi:hypothetical protein